MEEFLRVGVITSTHGLRGEVKVFPTTDDVKRFKSLKRAVIDTGAGLLPVEISQVRFFKNLAILKFKDLDSINDVEPYRKRDLLVKREDAVPLGPDEHFIADLIGLSVVTDGISCRPGQMMCMSLTAGMERNICSHRSESASWM